jgi:hypothetical protein
MGVEIGNKKGDKEKTDYHEIKKVETSKYSGEKWKE